MRKDEGAAGRLFIVSSPIGNLRDVSLRALDVLRSVTLIAAEDTRHSRKLLGAYEIRTPLVSLNAHNERAKSPTLIRDILGGKDIAYLADAGTPGISDPGFLLVNMAITAGLAVVPVPGVSAGLAALSVSGLPMHRFLFVGFLPANPSGRKRALAALRPNRESFVLYESPVRLLPMLRESLAVLGDRPALVAREMTKIHEEFQRGSLSELLDIFSARTSIKGEITIVIAGCRDAPEDFSPAALRAMVKSLREGSGLSVSQATREVSHVTGIARSNIYRLVLGDVQ